MVGEGGAHAAESTTDNKASPGFRNTGTAISGENDLVCGASRPCQPRIGHLHLGVPAAVAAGSEPETRPDDRGARASRLLRSDSADVGDDWLDAASPVSAFRPAPRDRVRQGKRLLGGSAPVFVAQLRAGRISSRALEQLAVG
jgi:hypothetical protein